MNMKRSISARGARRATSLGAMSAITLAMTMALTACGGGGSDAPSDATPPAIAATSSIIQGRWVSTDLDPAVTVIAVPASSGANTPVVDTLWGLAQDGSALYKVAANGAAGAAGAVTGKSYMLGTSMTESLPAGSYTLSGTQLTLQSALGETASFSRTDAMSTALRADQANGRWQASLGSIQVDWTVQTAGAANNFSGTSTSGCTYSGTTTVVASQSLYQVAFDENCAGVVERFSGVATMSSDDTRLTVVATNAGESRGAALLFTRQP